MTARLLSLSSTPALATKRQAIDALIADGYLAADGPALGGHPSLRLARLYAGRTPQT